MTDSFFDARWTTTSVDDDLRRWGAFLAENGITWSPSAQDRGFAERVSRASSERGGEAIEIRLAKLANDVLKASGDPRCVAKEVATRRWYVLTPEQRSELEKAGRRFDTGTEGALRQLATIPITLGVYFAALYGLRQFGVNQTAAWIIALVAWVITTRVVRGRWPFQR